jgi:hypothetical protein
MRLRLTRLLALAFRPTHDEWKINVQSHRYDDLESSHICHHSCCINFYHIVWEMRSINISRKPCTSKVYGRNVDKGLRFEDLVATARNECTHEPECFWDWLCDKRGAEEATESDWLRRRVHYMRCMDPSCLLLFERFPRRIYRWQPQYVSKIFDNSKPRPSTIESQLCRR